MTLTQQTADKGALSPESILYGKTQPRGEEASVEDAGLPYFNLQERDSIFEEMQERKEWDRGGYLAARQRIKKVDRVDKAVLIAADVLGFDEELLFEWANSRLGEHFAENGGNFHEHTASDMIINSAWSSMEDMIRDIEGGFWYSDEAEGELAKTKYRAQIDNVLAITPK